MPVLSCVYRVDNATVRTTKEEVDMRILIAWCVFMVGCGGGGVTESDLNAAKGLVHPLQPKEAARSALVEKLGEPKAETDTSSSWESASGTCKRLTVSWMGNVAGEATLSDC